LRECGCGARAAARGGAEARARRAGRRKGVLACGSVPACESGAGQGVRGRSRTVRVPDRVGCGSGSCWRSRTASGRPVRGRSARAVLRAAQAMMAAGPRDDGLEEALAAVAAAEADARRRESDGHAGRARVPCAHRRWLKLCGGLVRCAETHMVLTMHRVRTWPVIGQGPGRQVSTHTQAGEAHGFRLQSTRTLTECNSHGPRTAELTPQRRCRRRAGRRGAARHVAVRGAAALPAALVQWRPRARRRRPPGP